MKPVNSQAEESRDKKSEAITACVAITMVLSALDKNIAVMGASEFGIFRAVGPGCACRNAQSIKKRRT